MWRPLSEASPVYAAATAARDRYGYPVFPEAVTAAWKRGEITVGELAREHLRLIEQDVADDIVPWDVHDFSELHNFVDANEYTLAVMGLDSSDDGMRLSNAVQDRVAVMLRGSRPSSLDWPGGWPHAERQQAGKNHARDRDRYLQACGAARRRGPRGSRSAARSGFSAA